MALPLLHNASFAFLFLPFFFVFCANGLGSISSSAAVYGGNGPALCNLLSSPGTVSCYGSDAACVYGAPHRLPLSGLTAGDGFACGLTVSSRLPYCWGNNIYVPQGVPTPKSPNLAYADISAGDNHLCALRMATGGADCWGYNLTGSFLVGQPLFSITSGALFSCALLASDGTPVCWGDDTGSGAISGAPRLSAFRSISAGGYHVCGILQRHDGAALCWGRPLQGFPSEARFVSLVGGKFHACGLLASSRTPSCWGFVQLPNSTMTPLTTAFSSLVAGDYYTCGTPSDASQPPLCWGSQFPAHLPAAAGPAAPLICSTSCGRTASPDEASSSSSSSSATVQIPILVAELAIAIFVVACVFAAAVFFIRYKLSPSAAAEELPAEEAKKKKNKRTKGASAGSSSSSRSFVVMAIKKGSFGSSFRKEKVRPEDPKMFRGAEMLSLRELEQATEGFSEEYVVGKGSYSCVYRGVLSDGREVAVKRLMGGVSGKDSTEFRNEVDVLSRLNHAHLLTLLGFCEEGEERFLVYEYMANGALQEQLKGGGDGGRSVLGWVRRVTIAVQAARGLEYLHGYACPPVIHRDVKSSNILLDDDWNARLSDLGDLGGSAGEPPSAAGGYVDPEYYTHHYFTTKSDVYSFGVLLLEILSGRAATSEMVRWAMSLIKAGQWSALLDNRAGPPLPDLDAIARIARIAAKCVKSRAKDRPSMDKVTTSLERALATMIGCFSNNADPLLPSEVVLGSNRLHRKSSRKSSSSCPAPDDHSSSETTTTAAAAILVDTKAEAEGQNRIPYCCSSSWSGGQEMAAVATAAEQRQQKVPWREQQQQH